MDIIIILVLIDVTILLLPVLNTRNRGFVVKDRPNTPKPNVLHMGQRVRVKDYGPDGPPPRRAPKPPPPTRLVKESNTFKPK